MPRCLRVIRKTPVPAFESQNVSRDLTTQLDANDSSTGSNNTWQVNIYGFLRITILQEVLAGVNVA